jgi:phospholipase/carboxylesterase
VTTPAAFAPPVHVTVEGTDPSGPLVVLLHGRGSHEGEIITLAEHLPTGPTYTAVRAPIAEGGGYAWFANRGIGRPVAESLRATMAWFRDWLDEVAPPGRPVVLIGFSGGATFAGGLLLDDAGRYAGGAILYATLPFDAGVPTIEGRLSGVPVMVAHGELDTVIPAELLDRTWTYLLERSGARLTARRDRVGHVIAADALAALASWLEDRLAAGSGTADATEPRQE